MIRGLWHPESNLELIQWCCWQLAKVRSKLPKVRSKGITIQWRWARGHQGTHGNEMADTLAKHGASGLQQLFPALTLQDIGQNRPSFSSVPVRRRRCVKSGGPGARPAWDGHGPPWFMRGDFAEGDPMLSWQELSGILVQTASSVADRKVSAVGAPYSEEDLSAIHQLRLDLQALWGQLQQCDSLEEQGRIKVAHRTLSGELQRFRAKARHRFVKSICQQADDHFRFHDMGRFYKTLKQLGVHLSDHSPAGKMDHSVADMRAHCKQVSGSIIDIPDSVLDHVPTGEVADWLGDPPSPDEVRQAVRLRDCSAGRDEITAGMLRWAGPRCMECLIDLIRNMWVTHPDT